MRSLFDPFLIVAFIRYMTRLIFDNTIHISAGGSLGLQVSQVLHHFSSGQQTLILKASGNAISDLILLVEIVKRRQPDLHQMSLLGLLAKRGDSFKGKTAVGVPAIAMTLSTDVLDVEDPGYQEPMPRSELDLKPKFGLGRKRDHQKPVQAVVPSGVQAVGSRPISRRNNRESTIERVHVQDRQPVEEYRKKYYISTPELAQQGGRNAYTTGTPVVKARSGTGERVTFNKPPSRPRHSYRYHRKGGPLADVIERENAAGQPKDVPHRRPGRVKGPTVLATC